jgi:hypothetical protein
MPTTDVAIRDGQALAAAHELTVEEIVAQAKKIERVIREAMEEDVHYGTIPGTPKPTLYKAGAEKLCLLFRFDPQYLSTESRDGEHLIVKSVCTLWHITTGLRMGSGEGSCSTRESKYAWRFTKRSCPSCKAEAIGKSKEEYGGGWYCNKKAGGCGAGFKRGSDGAKEIEAQREVGKVPNPDLADQYNTVLKMANKRALVAAVLNVTAASDVFTQDLEDEEEPATTTTRGGQGQPPAGEGQARPNGGGASHQDPEAVINEKQVGRLSAIATGVKWTDDQVHTLLSGFKYNSRKDVKVKDYETICNRLKEGPEKGLATPTQQPTQKRLA